MPKNPISTIHKRILCFFLLLFVILGGLSARIAWIQFVQGKQMVERVQSQLMENRTLQSPRGIIYDRNGKELAISSAVKSLYADPQQLRQDGHDSDTVAALLAPILKIKPEIIKERLNFDGRFIWLKRTLEPEDSKAVQEIIKKYKIKGLQFVEENKRYYPNGPLAAHVLGFVGTDDMGLDGLEMVLDKEIKGKVTEQFVQTDNKGFPIFQSIFTFAAKNSEKNVYLTIDNTIQFIVEKSLDKVMASTRAQGATIIVMNPKNGEILAMASRPGFNPNEFYRYTNNEWKNRAVSIIYEPGSTFKSVVAASALEEKIISPEERFKDEGYIIVNGVPIKNWDGTGAGNISLVDVIKNSVNTGFVQIGMRLGAAKLSSYAAKFGFGKPTGIELPGEEVGILLKPEEMRDIDIATMSIGQTIAVTPLQLVSAVAAIANNGVLVKPHLIKEMCYSDGKVIQKVEAQVVRQVIDVETAKTTQKLLEKVISEGGGKLAEVKGYHFAGKTGTAEKLRETGGGYKNGHYIASFVGFGPVEDPEVVALIVIDDPAGNYYGGQIAAPVFSEIMSQIVRYLNIPPQEQIKQKVPTYKERQSTTVPSNLPPGKVLIPNVLGLTMREAGETISSRGLRFLPVGTGIAVQQSVAPNTLVNSGVELTVYFEPR